MLQLTCVNAASHSLFLQGIGLAVVQELCALGAQVRHIVFLGGRVTACAQRQLLTMVMHVSLCACVRNNINASANQKVRKQHLLLLLQVFLCSRNKEDVDACVQQLKEKGYQVQGAAIDVSDLAQRQQLVQQVSEAFGGKLNILGR